MEGLTAAVAKHLGAEVSDSHPLHGGSLSEIRLVTLTDGRDIIAKSGALVTREAQMLTAIGETGAPIPQILGQSGQILLLEALQETAPSRAAWRALGEGLKRLHTASDNAYGWAVDYAFGSLPICNRQTKDWPAFWAEHRLLATQSSLPPDLAHRLEVLASRLPEIIPTNPPSALLHGDLWGGNILFSKGDAYFIDPASYYGDGEVDLAMLHLFGSPDPVFTDVYGPIAPGWQERRNVYQLWPALVHLYLFGSGYRSMVSGLLKALGA